MERVWKHPRLRGEDDQIAGIERRFDGNTPAYAGKTYAVVMNVIFPKKHPRLRGEDGDVAAADAGAPETPPLTRGRPVTIFR